MKALNDATRNPSAADNARFVLLVDDNPMLLRCMRRALANCPLPLTTCTSPEEAIHWVAADRVSVVVSDISMPEMSGLTLMKKIHDIDTDLPVVLLTGVPCVDSAAEAVEHGAFSYLLKPIKSDVLMLTIERALRAYMNARQQREVLAKLGCASSPSVVDDLNRTLDEALQSAWLAYQPIVHVINHSIAGYEALLRSGSRVLVEPDAVLRAAELLNSMNRVGRQVRDRAAEELLASDDSVTLFVNLHPQDLLDDHLQHPSSALASVAHRVVLEITERAALSGVANLSQKIRHLRAMGFRIAVDDLGAGYSGLHNVTELEPEFIKLDMSLVRGIDHSDVKQKVVSSLISLGNAMGTSIIAEGIETRAECRMIVELGCTLLQGYLFARPEREFPLVNWPSAARHASPQVNGDSAGKLTQSGVHQVHNNKPLGRTGDD